MEKIKEYKGIIIIVLIITLGAFYWFQIRPTHIRKECNNKTFLYNSSNNQEPINSPAWLDKQEKLYQDCLRFEGLEK